MHGLAMYWLGRRLLCRHTDADAVSCSPIRPTLFGMAEQEKSGNWAAKIMFSCKLLDTQLLLLLSGDVRNVGVPTIAANILPVPICGQCRSGEAEESGIAVYCTNPEW
jgi:hypothetical protein